MELKRWRVGKDCLKLFEVGIHFCDDRVI